MERYTLLISFSFGLVLEDLHTLFGSSLSLVLFMKSEILIPLPPLYCALFRERKKGVEGISLNMANRVGVKIRESVNHSTILLLLFFLLLERKMYLHYGLSASLFLKSCFLTCVGLDAPNFLS
jgi:hypothetical protein